MFTPDRESIKTFDFGAHLQPKSVLPDTWTLI